MNMSSWQQEKEQRVEKRRIRCETGKRGICKRTDSISKAFNGELSLLPYSLHPSRFRRTGHVIALLYPAPSRHR